MKILAVETSCDDTGIAILSAQGGPASGWKVLSNIVSSQIQIHKKYGGVFPALAKREHQKNLVPVLVRSLTAAQMLSGRASPQRGGKLDVVSKILEREPELLKKIIPFLKKYQKPDVDLIAVTNGPGLEPCLWVGVNFAKVLSYAWDIPIVPVDHIESHILVNLLENPKISFPAIALVVSGGHTQIILVKGVGKYKILGETRDDAAGECFDKCAKILGLGYPGGPIISKLAERYALNPVPYILKLPRPMMGTPDYDFSFSGLKTAVLYADRKIKNNPSTSLRAGTKKYKQAMSAEVQQAIIDVLIKKTIKAVKDFNVKSLILGGGVSANQELRKQFELKVKKENLKVDIVYPKKHLSTDNGLMIAVSGFYHKNKIQKWQSIIADGNLRIS